MRKALVLGWMMMMVSVAAICQIEVSVTADRDTIEFGQEIVLNYIIKGASGQNDATLDFSPLRSQVNLAHSSQPEVMDSLMDIEIVDGGVFQVSKDNMVVDLDGQSGPLPENGTITLRVNSVGVFLPAFPLVNGRPVGSPSLQNSVPIFVMPPANGESINPNWGIIEEEVSWKDYLIYLYVVLGLGAIVLGAFFISKKLRKKAEVGNNFVIKKKIVPAHEIALKDLKLLKAKELWQQGEVKAYHTELTRIMRQYIEDRYSVQALEMTSSQLKRELNKQQIGASVIARFNDILQIADKVKFAKGDAGPEINTRFMQEAFAIVEETKQIKTEGEEEET